MSTESQKQQIERIVSGILARNYVLKDPECPIITLRENATKQEFLNWVTHNPGMIIDDQNGTHMFIHTSEYVRYHDHVNHISLKF